MRISVQALLLFSVFVVATCGLVYELVAGTLASYLLGDSVTQFSTIIGLYLFSMGIGSYLSRFFNKNLIAWFIQIEVLVALVGGFSSTILFLLFDRVASFQMVLYLLVSLTGILVGLEIPLIMRILEDRFEFKELVSKIFTFDYIGALLASVIFPLVLVPHLGLLRTSYFFGLLNAGVALWLCFYFTKELRGIYYLRASCAAAILSLVAGFIMSDRILAFTESLSYADKIIYSVQSPYQKIVLTKNDQGFRLFLNGNLQFSSADEYRYHEALVHPGLNSVASPKKVLVMGGGDGLAVREILRYPSIEKVVLVDLDKAVTELFSSHEVLKNLNQQALLSKKVTVINTDAFQWLKNNKEQFDFVVIDFPDPANYAIGKLYTNTFYKVLRQAIAPDGAAVIQATSPFVAPNAYWCVVNTLTSCGFATLPYHAHVPSFGDWGFVLASPEQKVQVKGQFLAQLKFLDGPTFEQMRTFPKDMPARETEINKLNNQALVRYFEDEWATYIN
ncbi:spermidine synthase [Rufibacter radiotolerans]|uniref:Polyamine aminopropyltransferase n=1 Tax=Rufibacter radiotolerans TaxID=1379910 RepID=A0A0H4W640_9BACT|nr:polyamine aminopropyltransferase [Rufibacter radiotolerans]AKQ45906.1 spermidine synthase [Rufibacter radiotolerans]